MGFTLKSEMAKSFFYASEATFNNFFWQYSGRFRSLSLSAIDYISKQKNILITESNRSFVKQTLDLGVQINDFYDLQMLSNKNYKKVRRNLKKDQKIELEYDRYFKTIRQLERDRPEMGDEAKCISYRENCNLVSLAINCALAFNMSLTDFVDLESINKLILNSRSPDWFQSIYYSVMSLQVVDDMIGYQGDFRNKRPTYFTAFTKQSEVSITKDQRNIIFKKMSLVYNHYIEAAKAIDANFISPVTFLSQIIHFSYPKIAQLADELNLKMITRIILTKRDRLKQ